MDNRLNIAFIGFGEAADAFVGGLDRTPVTGLTAYDIKTDQDADSRQWMEDRYHAQAVNGASTLAEALANADVVFSVVTADQAALVAKQAASLLSPGALFFDCNSCAPQTKKASAQVIDDAGGRYVDVAVMAPVHPGRHRTPLLLSGDHANAAKIVFDRLNMNATIESGPVGTSSSVKMVRSIMVKGMEALFAECVVAGRLAGVDEQVLASLEASHPGFEWTKRAGYNLERMAQHGIRRAAEMDEVCEFLHHLGIDEPLSAGTVRWQRRVGELGLTVSQDDYQTTADALIHALTLTPMKEADS